MRILEVMASAHKFAKEPALRWLRRAPAGIAAVPTKQPQLGVLSGTFNPPTRAHLALAECAAQEFSLGEVLFVLPEIAPHKEQLEASLDARAEMLVRAVAGDPRFSAAITTHGLLLDIYRAVAPHYPREIRVFFLTGRDAAERILLRWPYGDPQQALAELFARAEFIVAGRRAPFVVPPGALAACYAKKIHHLVLTPELESLSATEARERLRRGQPITDLVPPPVAEYIRRRGLYKG